MQHTHSQKHASATACVWLLLLGIVLALTGGCGRSEAPPATIAADRLPGVLEAAFAKSDPDTKGLAQQTVEYLKQNHYPLAFNSLQALTARSGLTKVQNQTLASAMLTLNNLLQNAQSQGDTAAAKTLQAHRQSK